MDLSRKTIAKSDLKITDASQQDLLLQIDKMKKELEIQTFLSNKYKSDYEVMKQFFNTSVMDVQKKNEELLDVNLKLERFAYVVAHDLKAPLRTISSFSNLLAKRNGTESGESKTYLDFILNACDQMSDLISDTLEYSKLEDNNIKIQEVDLNRMCQSIESILLAEKKEYRVILNYEDLPIVKGNKAMMYKLFMNIIQNGLKYNKSDVRTIEVTHSDSTSHHTFEFKDNGIGLVGKNQEAIFEMFIRVHNPSEFEGTGIGLAMCKKIVESHKGEISVTTKENEGCIFKCTIAKKLND